MNTSWFLSISVQHVENSRRLVFMRVVSWPALLHGQRKVSTSHSKTIRLVNEFSQFRNNYRRFIIVLICLVKYGVSV